MKTALMALVAASLLAACTTAEKTAAGAGIGAAAGAAITRTPGGAIAGALIGGFGTFIAEVADGRCQYRNSKGQIYTTRCHWLR